MEYIISVVTWVLVAGVGGWLVNQGVNDWYLTITKPSWTPGGAVIGAVWTVLYVLITVAMIVAWKKLKNQERRTVLWMFGINAVLNAAWNYFFFTAHTIGLALAEILILEAATLYLIWYLWPRVRVASYLLIPYAAWVAFASYLTYTILALN